MKKSLLLQYAVIVLFQFVAITLFASTDTLKISGDFNYPPYSYIDINGVEQGYDIDVINAIAKEMKNAVVEFKLQHWDSALNALKNKEVDLIAGIVYSEERDAYFDFTIPLHTEYYALFCRKELRVDDINDLKGKKVIVLEGDIANEKFLLPMGFMSNVVYTKSLPDGLGMLEQGKGDFIVAPYPLGMGMLKKNKYKNVEVKGPPVLPAVYCLAVAEGNTALLAQLNEALESLIIDKGLNEIHQKWIKYKRDEDRYEALFNYSFWGLVVAVVVLTFVLLLWFFVRKQLAKKIIEIREVESVYHNIFMSMTDAVLIFSLKGYVVDANPIALDLYGYSHEEIILKHGKDIIEPENIPLFDKYVGRINNNETIVEEAIVKKVNNRTVYLNMHATLVNFNGTKHHMVMFRNVTKEREAALKLIKAQEESDSANRTKSAFLSTVSHEIRTPLNAIIGFTKLLSETDLNVKQTDYTNKIDISGSLLLNLINDILDMTKIEAGKLLLDEEPFQLKPLLNRLIDVQRIKAESKDIGIELTVSANTPDLFRGDSLRLFQVLLNLVSNAIKFTEQGEVLILVRGGKKFKVDGISYQRIWFTIKDTGIGIPGDKLNKLFVPFVQVDRANARNYGGSGLGLAISKHLVDLMDGEMYVESKVDKGSMFSFFINLQIVDNKDLEHVVERVVDTDLNIDDLRVLLVEDNQFNAQIFEEQLVSSGAIVVHAFTGEDAIEALVDNAFDIILMDIELPGIDGFETTRRIRKYARWFNVPIIALSAHAMREEKEKALQVGMVDYLSKPLQIEDLLRAIIHYTKGNIHEPLVQQNVLSGLKNFDGDELMFTRALIRFKKVYAETSSLIIDLFQQGKFPELKTIAHNLKSGAGMIGAMGLSKTAGGVEKQIKKTEKVEEEKVNLFVLELSETLEYITRETTE